MERLFADKIIQNGVVLTVNSKDEIAEAVAIRGDRILAVGSSADIAAYRDDHTQVIDAGGKTVSGADGIYNVLHMKAGDIALGFAGSVIGALGTQLYYHSLCAAVQIVCSDLLRLNFAHQELCLIDTRQEQIGLERQRIDALGHELMVRP